MSEEKQAKSISGFWRRLGAFAIDGIILGLFGQGLGVFFGELFVDLGAWGSLMGFAIALVYFGVMNSEIAAGQTLGKKVMKIRVVDGDNQPISLIKSFGRFSIFGIPYFLNGASPQFPPPEMLTTFWAYVLTIIIFGGLSSIVYLYLFNRNTRQSLHDLLMRTYVVNVGMDKQHVVEMWRPHVAVVSLLFLCPAIVLVPVFSTDLQQQQQFADPVSIEQLLRENPAVSYASVEGGERITRTLRTGTGTTETTYVIAETSYVIANVFLRKNEVSNTKLARELAELVATNYQDVQKKDVLKINLIYGYHIGIYGQSIRYPYNFNAQEFEIKTETNNAKVQNI